jgi:hypothetical protein
MNGERTNGISFLRVRFSLLTAAFGLLIFTIGAKPSWFGWDRTAVVGFTQIVVFLIGLALICLGGFVGLSSLWGREQRSIIADIGLRLVGTGYVITGQIVIAIGFLMVIPYRFYFSRIHR